MTKRKTRSMNMNEDDAGVCETGLPLSKRGQSKKTCASKLLFEKNVENTPVGEPTFTTLTPVSLDQHKNVNDQENTPPPLIIDLDNEACSSQSVMSHYFPRTKPVGERLPRGTPNASDRTQSHVSSNPSRYLPNEHRSVSTNRSNGVRLPEENVTPVVDRSTKNQQASNIRSQSSSSSRIVVSVDRSGRDSNKDFNYSQRTSTPIRPSRREQVNIGLADCFNDSFSVDSIPKETHDILSRFPEFRRLVKAYNNERKKSNIWSKDFARLKNDYQQLEASSFPRPPPTALSYLVDLVAQIQQSGGRGDPRSDDQLARDLGENPIFLMSLKDVTPQQTALNVFNHLYPGYETKADLRSIDNMEIAKPGAIDTILTFAQRAVPGSNYKMQDLRDGLSNSIRGARYQWRKMTGSIAQAAALVENNDNPVELQDENHLDRVNQISIGDYNMHTNRPEVERRFNTDDERF